MISVTATPIFRRRSYYQEKVEQPADVTYASVVVLVLAFATVVGLGGWLIARRRRRAIKRRLAPSAPPTPQIAIQEYKPEYDRVSFHLPLPGPPVPPSPIHLSPAWSANPSNFAKPTHTHTQHHSHFQPGVSPRVSFVPKTPSPLGASHISARQLQIERPARATLPATGSKRLSLNLPTSSSLSLELQEVVNVSIGTTPSLVPSSASDSSISGTTSADSDMSCVTQSQSEPLSLIRKHVTEDPFRLRPGHASMFTLPPIITSPVFSEVSDWNEESRSSALLSIVVVPRDAAPDSEQKPALLSGDVKLSDTHQDLIQNFKRFSNCAFASSSSLSSAGSARQVPSKGSESSQLSGVESRGSFDGRCKSPTVVNVEETSSCRPAEAIVTTFASEPRAIVEDAHQQKSLSPWEKVALLSRKHIETLSSYVPTPPIPFRSPANAPEHVASATPCTPASLDLPFASPQPQGSPIPNTPEIVLRGMRSQIFESPVIPSHFSTPTPDGDGFEDIEDKEGLVDQGDELTGVESILSALALDASEDVEIRHQSLQSTPCAPSQFSPTATINFLVGSPSPSFQASSPVQFEDTSVIDDFTEEILNMIPRGDTPTPSASGSSLNQALVGIGLAFVGTESNSETDLGILNSMDSVATRRYLARELSATCEPSCTMDPLSSIEEEDEKDATPGEEELPSSPTIDAIIKMNQILSIEPQSTELTAMSPPPNGPVTSPNSDVGSLPSSPEFDLKASGLAEGSRNSWVLMQAVRTLVSAARSAVVAPQLSDLQISVHDSGLPLPPLSAASDSSFASSVDGPRTPLCPPLVVVTSPSVGVLLKQLGPSAESIMDEAGDQAVFVIQSDSDSDYGASDEESGSEYDVDEPFDLENYADSESGGERDRKRSPQPHATTKTSSSSVISPSSSGSSAGSGTRIPTLRRNKLKSPVIDFTEGGKHTVQLVHRPKRNPSLRISHFPHFSSTVVRHHRAVSHIPRYRRHRRASKEVDSAESVRSRRTVKQRAVQAPGSSPDLGAMTEGEDDLLVDQTFPGRLSGSSTENDG